MHRPRFQEQPGFGQCSLHGKRRYLTDLVDMGDGTFRCSPGHECFNVEKVSCAVHNITRMKKHCKEVSTGVFNCLENFPCRSAGEGQQLTDTSHYGSAVVSSETRGASNFYAAGVAAPSARKQNVPPMTSTTGSSDASSSAAIASRNPLFTGGTSQQQQSATSSSSSSTANQFMLQQQQPQKDANQVLAQFVLHQQRLMMMQQSQEDNLGASTGGDSANLLTGGGVGGTTTATNYTSFARQHQFENAEVWCCRHGRRLQLRAAKTNDCGMSYYCIDPTECLSVPLEDPKLLAAKGCRDLMCSKHKRMRGTRWLQVDPHTGRSFICKKPHSCRPIDEDAVEAD